MESLWSGEKALQTAKGLCSGLEPYIGEGPIVFIEGYIDLGLCLYRKALLLFEMSTDIK